MSFIIEILPVMSNEGAFAYVVRAQNGFPLGVFNSLEETKEFIATKHTEALKASKQSNGDN